jgi:hypothetical protein
MRRGMVRFGKHSFELVANANVTAGRGRVRHGKAGRGWVRQGEDSLSWWRFRECQGEARSGPARHGLARPGWARRGLF